MHLNADLGPLTHGIDIARYHSMSRVTSTLGTLSFILGLVISNSGLEATEHLAVIYCERPQETGLYRQCQRALLMADLGGMARIYSSTERKLLTVHRNKLFIPEISKSEDKAVRQSTVAVVGKVLWNNTSEDFLSLCKIESMKNKRYIEMSCGRHQKKRVAFENVMFLQPLNQKNSLQL
jgi:hypothetical protein